MKKFLFTIVALIVAVVSASAGTKTYCMDVWGHPCSNANVSMNTQGEFDEIFWAGDIDVTVNTGEKIKEVRIYGNEQYEENDADGDFFLIDGMFAFGTPGGDNHVRGHIFLTEVFRVEVIVDTDK